MQPIDDLLNTAPCGFMSSTESGIILAVNATLLDLLGYGPGDLSGRHIEAILPIISRLLYHSYLVSLLVMQGRVDEATFSLQVRGGDEVPVLANAVRRERGGATFYDWVFMPMHLRAQYEDEILRAKKALDESVRLQVQANAALREVRVALEAKQAELMEANVRLEALATLDELTGLKNRRAFQDQLDFQIALARRIPSPLSVLIIDIDYFKHINDTFGHPTGDRYLQALATILRHSSREIDMVARYGGEEFVVILPNTSQIDAITVAEKFRKRVEAERWADAPITVSIGASTLSSDIHDRSSLLASADWALYTSKRCGRSRTTHAYDVNYGEPR